MLPSKHSKNARSLGSALFESFRQVHAELGSLFAIVIGFLIWDIKPDAKIPAFWVVGASIFVAIIIWTCINALHTQLNAAPNTPDLTISSAAKRDQKDSNVLLLSSPYELTPGILLSLFRREKNFETFTGFAEVIETQSNGMIQARIYSTDTALMTLLSDTSNQEELSTQIFARLSVSLRALREQNSLTRKLIQIEDADAPEQKPVTNLEARKDEVAPTEPQSASGHPENKAKEEASPSWLTAVLSALKAGDFDEAERLYQSEISKEENALKRKKRLANFRKTQFEFGAPNALDELKNLTLDSDIGKDARVLLGKCFESIGEHMKALEQYKQIQDAGSNKPTETEATAIIGVSRTLKALGRSNEGISALESFIRSSIEDVDATVYEALADLYDARGQGKLSAVAKYAAFRQSPNQSGSSFDAAYALSKAGLEVAAAGVYKANLKIDADSVAALNNLAFIHDQFDMPIEAVNGYAKSAKLGGARACGNLAHKALNSGFHNLAKEYIDKGLELDKTDDRVGSAISSLTQAIRVEEEGIQKLEEKSGRLRAFLSGFVQSAWRSKFENLQSLSGAWRAADNKDYRLMIEAQQLKLLTGEGASAIRYSGYLCGGAAYLKRKEKTYSFQRPGPTLVWKDEGDAMLFINPNLEFIELLDLSDDKSPKHIRLNRLSLQTDQATDQDEKQKEPASVS